jgi:hypothetical protein
LPVSAAGGAEVEVLPDGSRRAVVRRLRVEEGPDGSIRVARDLLPDGTAGPLLSLPARLGGGTVFSTSMGGTTLHHAPEFLGPLRPLARFRASPMLLSAAPDRLLLRAADGGRLHAIELPSGAISGPVGMPVAPRVGQVFFADAFRGVADVDLLGLMATEDAGASWHPLGVTGPFLEMSRVEGGIVVSTPAARYTVDPSGQISAGEPLTITAGRATTAASPASSNASGAKRRGGRGLLGPTPAITTVERGIGLPDGTALVAEGGSVLRVSLADFSVVGRSKDRTSLDRDDSCHAVAFGAGVAFVCGGEANGTSLHLVDSLLETREIARFSGPRSVRASGRGGLVVSGPCPTSIDASGRSRSTATLSEAARTEVCVLDGVHPPRAVRTRGDVGRERIMAFADGRVLVLEPPNDTGSGLATLVRLDGTTVPISLRTPELGEARPTQGEKALREGFWTHDLAEISPTEIATWVELSNEVRGVRIHLDSGEIAIGTPRPTALTAIAGLKGLTLNDAGRGAETTDGGLTWAAFDQPDVLRSKTLPGRFCSSIGCILPFEPVPWVRVGWGSDAEPPFTEAVLPRTADDVETSRPFGLACDLVELRDPPKDAPRPLPNAENRRLAPTMVTTATRQGDWEPFVGLAPPAVPKGFGRYDNGSPASGVQAELYAWTPLGATTRDPSRWLARFVDRFDPDAPVRSTAAGPTPFATEEALAELLGYRSSTSTIQTFLDPGGHAALLAIGRSGGEWDLVSAVEGRVPVLMAPPAEPWTPLVPSLASAAWLDGTWVVAVQQQGIDVRIATPNETRRVARLPRLAGATNEAIRVVRRAHGSSVGILVGGMSGTGGGRVHHIVPVDLDSGKIGEIVRLGQITLGDRIPRVCAPDEDGWLVDVGVGGGATVRLPQGATVTDPEVRARLDPGKACLDGVSARLGVLPLSARPKPIALGPKPTVAKPGTLAIKGVLGAARPLDPAQTRMTTGATKTGQAGRPQPTPSDVADPRRQIPLVATDSSGRRLIARCGPL